MRRIALLVLCTCLVSSAAPAQDEPIFAGFVSVDLVLVDVVVEDSAGNPVLDLEREDFLLFQDGKPVEISHFTPASGSDGVASYQPAARAQPRRLIVFVDNLHLRPNSRKQVFDDLSRALDTYLAPEDEVMLVTYGGTTQVALEMTHDRKALKRALREQADAGAVSLLAPNEDQRVIDLIQQIRGPWDNSWQSCQDVGPVAHAHAQQVYSRVVGTVSELNRFVNSLAGYEGPKVLLHVSDGIPLVAGSEAYRYAAEMCDGSALNQGIDNATDTTLSTQLRGNYWDPTQTAATLREFDTADEWTRLASHANTYQVSFYTFQARQQSEKSSTVTDTRTTFNVELEAKRNRQDALYLLADETGGIATLDATDLEPVLARMQDDSSYRYQLAFEPPSPGDGRQHRIRVDVERPGVVVRHRKSYSSKPADERVEDRVVSALLHGLSDNPLGIRLEVGEKEQVGRDLSHVKIYVHVPLDEIVLLPEEQVRRGMFTVFVAVRNGFDQVSPVGRKIVPVRVPLTGGEDEFVYSVEVPVRGTNGAIAVAVQDNLGAEISYLEQEVRLPTQS